METDNELFEDITPEQLQQFLNTDLTQPHPDPSWDYYSHWNALSYVRNKVDELISDVSQIEDATKETDLNIASKINHLRGYLDALVHELTFPKE